MEDSVFSRCLMRARGASDVIDVMGGDSGSPGVGSRRPQRKRMKTTRAIESMLQENDMDWEEENSSERISRNHKNRTVQATAAERAGEETRGPEQPTDSDFNNKLDTIKAEVQMQFKSFRDHVTEEIAKEIAKEMAKMTAQLTQELSQAREELTQARSELEDTRLQLQAMKESSRSPIGSASVCGRRPT